MLDALPGHIGDVQQAVDATEVDECAVIGEVLDNTLDGIAFLKLFKKLSRALQSILFQQPRDVIQRRCCDAGRA